MYISYEQNRRNKRRRIIGAILLSLISFGAGCGTSIVMAKEHVPVEEEIRVAEDAMMTVASSSEVTAAQMQRITELAMEQQNLETEAVEASIPLIVLDPGHGGEDEGCARAGVMEKDINLSIAKAVKQKLEQMGYDVLMTREGDADVSLEQRVCLANEKQASLYISIHQNACEEESSDIRGVETYYSSTKGQDGSERLAKLLQKEITGQTDALGRDVIDRKELYVVRETAMPSCLVETGFLSNREDRELLTTTEYQDRLAAAIADSVELFFHPKTMYLTFDDGPSAENTAAVLDILKEHNIKATFFLVGENVERHPEIAKRIVEEGHTVGIHCNRHEYEELYASVDSYIDDFEEAQRIVYETTGVETKLFRFPGGSINAYDKAVYQDIIEAMTEKGYIYYDWNASLEDAVSVSTPESLIANGVESTMGRKRVVLLAHDVVYNTTLCLDDLLDQFPEYEMLPLTEEVEPVQF